MRFYQFPEITSRDSSLATRAKRTSYAQKLSDTFYLFSGPMLPFSFENGMRLERASNKYKNSFTFGLLDYPLFILKFARYGLFRLAHYADEKSGIGAHALFWSAAVLFGILSIIHFAISGFFTLLCSPIVFFVHRYYKAEGDKLRETFDRCDTDNKRLYVNSSSIPCKIKFRDCYVEHHYKKINLGYVKYHHYNIEAIRFVRLPQYDDEVVKVVCLLNDYKGKFIIFRDTPEGKEAFKAFVALNMANYEKFVRYHSLLEESQLSTYSLALRDFSSQGNALVSLSNCRPENSNTQQIDLPGTHLPKELIAQILLVTAKKAEEAGVKKERILNLASLFRMKGAIPEFTPTQAPIPTTATK